MNFNDKSPITYPGSKNLARKRIFGILKALGAETQGLCSPFLGGGSAEVYAVAQGIDVHASDGFQPLVHFWKTLQSEPQHLANCIYQILKGIGYKTTHGGVQRQDTIEKLRYISKKCFTEKDALKRAAYFYIRNKTCYAGLMFKNVRLGSDIWDKSIVIRTDSKRDISMNMIKDLFNFASPMNIDFLDYRDALAKHPFKVCYADPPYMNKEEKHYGCNGDMHSGFNHKEFYERITSRYGDFAVSYNNHPEVLEMYKDFHVIQDDWAYGMTNDRNADEPRELIICSRNPFG